jgi:NAD(P)-dependent dehydrogenase (short-subunit alcohol dehydrogenase family)
MDLNLKGRVAVVTGGAAGIGEAIASVLAAEGCKICIVDRNADTGRQAASTIATSGNQARSAAADVGDPAEVTRVFGECHNRKAHRYSC